MALNPKILDALNLEQKFYDIILEAEEHGVLFDQELAKETHTKIVKQMTEIEEKILPNLPDMPIPKSRLKYPPKLKFKKDGTPSANAVKYFGDLLVNVYGEWYVFTPEEVLLKDANEPLVTHEPPSLGALPFIKNHLMVDYKWRPHHWNIKKDSSGKPVRIKGQYVKTTPRFNEQQSKELCPDLVRLGEKVEWVKDLIIWLTLRHRKNFILSDNGTGLLAHPRLQVDGRLPAGMDTLGANTCRVQHRVVANVPSVGKLYGKELRSLFTVPENRIMVGFDFSGLEDRVKAHRTFKYDKGEYARKVLDPDFDVHTENAKLWGVSRSEAKSPQYALIYNCSESTFTKTLGCSQAEGKKHYESFWDLNWALRAFNKKVEEFYDLNGYLPGLDGRKLNPRSKHSLSNLIFQSDGVIIVKRAGVILNRMLINEGLDAKIIIMYHDEYIVESSPEDAERVLELAIEAAKKAGRYYNCQVEFTAEGKIGRNWADVH